MNERREREPDRRDAQSVRSGEVPITREDDILRARQATRDVVEDMEFRLTDVTRIVTAVSELARNVHLYAEEGTMSWEVLEAGDRSGIELTFEDDGPGIDDVEAALRGEHSTSDGMGRGITGTKELMDEIEIDTGEEGTTIVIRKWHR